MRQRSLRLLAHLPLILSFVVLSMAPLDAFATTTTSAHSSAAQPRPHFFWKPNLSGRQSGVVAAASNNVTWHAGPIMPGTTQVYAIFWEPTGNVSPSYNSLLVRYFQDVGNTPLYHNNTQYLDTLRPFGIAEFPTNSVFAGSWVDRSAYPESPLLDSDIRNEVTKFDLSLATSGPFGTIQAPGALNTIFFVFTEAGQNLCYDSSHTQCESNVFCGYHSAFNSGLGFSATYAAIPYAASFNCDIGSLSFPNDRPADLTINIASHEQMEAATDPMLDAWYDSNGNEIGDKCAWFFGPRNSAGANVTWNGHSYLVQQEWDNNGGGCVLSGP